MYVLSARLSLEMSECKVCLPCEVILDWIKAYKVCQKPWGLSGSPAIIFDPPSWCGAARTLCAGDVETPFLGGCLRGDCLCGEPLWLFKWFSWERLGDREAIFLCGVLQQHGLGVA
jgi:hypothetical protein